MKMPSTWGEWSSLGAVLALMGGLYLHLHTDLEAAEVQEQLEREINQLTIELTESNKSLQRSIDRSEILRLTREVRRLEKQKEEPGANVIGLQADIDYYNGIIACIRAQLPICEGGVL